MGLESFLKLVWGGLSLLEKGMILFTPAAYLFFAVYSPSAREKAAVSVVMGANSLIRISLLLLSGVFLGSLVGALLPRGLVAGLLGRESGLRGILLGILFGAVMPGGPYVLFPILAALHSSGAAMPPMVAMIFAWSCIALTRIPMELGYLSVVEGQKIIWLRVLVGIPLPLIAGLLVGIIMRAS
ncbi:MAG: hypothetical protein ACE5OO_08815 [Candidatus Bathyarchaeia archaeon]